MPAKRSAVETRPAAAPRPSGPDGPREWPEWIARLRQRIAGEGPGKREWAEKAGNFILELMDLSEAALTDAAGAPDNWHAMLRAMGSPELLEQMQQSDPLARAFLNGLDAKRRLIEQNGGVFKTEQVGEYLGISPNTVHLRTFLWYPVLDRRTADGTHSGRTAEGCSNHRPHQFGRPDQNISAG